MLISPAGPPARRPAGLARIAAVLQLVNLTGVQLTMGQSSLEQVFLGIRRPRSAKMLREPFSWAGSFFLALMIGLPLPVCFGPLPHRRS
jgi:hypothetical protein